MGKIKQFDLDGDRVFMKKTKKNWKVVFPHRINGKINWKNLIAGGNWFNLLWITIAVILILGSINEYSNAVNVANECLQSNKVFTLGGIN